MEVQDPIPTHAQSTGVMHDDAMSASPHEPPRERQWGSGPRGNANHRINLGGRRGLTSWTAARPAYNGNVEPAYDTAPDADSLRDARVLIVDDCTLYRDYLADVISAHGATFTGVAWDLPSLLAAFEDILPRVILINLATRDSAALLRQALMIGPTARIIVIGVSEDDEAAIVSCAEAGVAGYHMRNDSLAELLSLVQRVANGETFCSPQVSAILLRRLSTLASTQPTASKDLDLTTRETQILKMLELGLSNRDIADQLHIAVHTVKNHVHSLLGKLNVTSRAQAAALSRSLRHGGDDPRN